MGPPPAPRVKREPDASRHSFVLSSSTPTVKCEPLPCGTQAENLLDDESDSEFDLFVFGPPVEQ